MHHDFFSGIKQWEFERDGIKGKLPCFYYDTSSFTAIYTASTKAVRQLLPRPEMRPVEMLPGKCLVSFTAFEYKKTDIDPYNEFSIAFLITYGSIQIPLITPALQTLRRRITAYVWQLPVTTEIARKGGVEMYGYPKFIADIEFERTETEITCKVSEKGKKILALHGKILPTRREKVTHITTYSVIDGIPLRTNIHINPIEFAMTTDKNAAQIEFGGNHQIAETLKDIELSSKPVGYQFSPKNQAILFPGRNLRDQ